MTLHPFAKELQGHQIDGDEASNDEYKTHNGSFGVYFRNKQVKLDTQAKETHNKASSIFANCIIYITGYTVPSAPELKRLIVENGGQVCAFLGGKSYATHIVATSLTSRKKELYGNVKVVKPAWIVESVKLGKALNWTRYRTIQVAGNKFFNEPSDIENRQPIESDKKTSDEQYEENLDAKDDLQGILEGEVSEEDEDQTDEADDLLNTPGPAGDAARIDWIKRNRQRVNCLDSHFISDYFAKSRLHFLTTRKLELRKRCRQYKAETMGKQGQEPIHRTIMHVDFDSFFVAAALIKHPELKTKPVCVSHGSDGSDIASCNYVARQSGVANGMWIARAKQTCPDLICLPYDFDEFTRCSDHLYDTLLKLRPLHITAISVDEALLDISNLVASGDQSIGSLSEHVRRTVKGLTNIDVSVGVGTNILLAKLALKSAKPAGQFYISDPTQILDFNIRDLPGVGRHIYARIIEELQVNTVRDLQTVSLSQLQAKIGNAFGQKLYGYARGMDTSDIVSLDLPVKSVGMDIGWGVRVIDESEKNKFTINCVSELWSRLEKSGALTESLTVKVYKMSKSASFIAPKHMGHGLCDIISRSRRVSPRTTYDELQRVVESLVKSLECSPLEFRGLGLHLKVSEHNSALAHPNQALITDMRSNEKTPPHTRKTMISVPPRKRRRGITLTQMVTSPPHTDKVNGQPRPSDLGAIDMDVFAELPSQIRREILRNEDDYNVPPIKPAPLGPPLYKKASGFGVNNPAELRNVIKLWVQASEAPTAEDAHSFWEYICEAIKEDSAWTSVLDTCDWLKLMVDRYASHPDWDELYRLVDTHVQEYAQHRV